MADINSIILPNGNEYYFADSEARSIVKLFTVTLTVAGWSSNAQTVSDVRLLRSGYTYIVTPAGASMSAYSAAGVYADDVTVSGMMTFHCAKTPTAALTVNVARLGVFE